MHRVPPFESARTSGGPERGLSDEQSVPNSNEALVRLPVGAGSHVRHALMVVVVVLDVDVVGRAVVEGGRVVVVVDVVTGSDVGGLVVAAVVVAPTLGVGAGNVGVVVGLATAGGLVVAVGAAEAVTLVGRSGSLIAFAKHETIR